MDRNLMTAKPDEILEAKVLYTIIGGKIVFQAEDADLIK